MPTLRCSIPSILIILVIANQAFAQDELTGRSLPSPSQTRGAASPPINIVFTNLAGDPSAAVPGFPDFEFNTGGGPTNFDRIFGSPNGNWILSALTTASATEDEIVLVNGVMAAREGTPAPWTGGSENIGLIDTALDINDDGDWAFSTNTDGPTGNDEWVVRVSNGTFASVAQEGQAVPAVPGATWGSSLLNAVIGNDGNVGLIARGLGGTEPGQSNVLVQGVTILAQSGVTVPAGQLGSEFWENFTLNGFHLSADGSAWLAPGDLTGDTASDDVVVVNGSVVVQANVVLAASGFAEPVGVGGIGGVHMDGAGNWFVRGSNADTQQDWIYRNGEVIATLGDPIIEGATEVWTDAEFSDCFFLHTGNARGDFVIGGVSDGPTPSNGLLVANNSVIVAREGDPIDLNGNGIDDDDLFFNTFGNDDGYLSDAGLFYFTATLKNGAGSAVAQGIFIADLREALGIDEIFADRFE